MNNLGILGQLGSTQLGRMPNRAFRGGSRNKQESEETPFQPINRGVPGSEGAGGLLGGPLGQPTNAMSAQPWQQRMGLLGPMSYNQQQTNLSQNNPVDPNWYYQNLMSMLGQNRLWM